MRLSKKIGRERVEDKYQEMLGKLYDIEKKTIKRGERKRPNHLADVSKPE